MGITGNRLRQASSAFTPLWQISIAGTTRPPLVDKTTGTNVSGVKAALFVRITRQRTAPMPMPEPACTRGPGPPLLTLGIAGP